MLDLGVINLLVCGNGQNGGGGVRVGQDVVSRTQTLHGAVDGGVGRLIPLFPSRVRPALASPTTVISSRGRKDSPFHDGYGIA